jgi:ssDNA-binding replication factor A large subunit
VQDWYGMEIWYDGRGREMRETYSALRHNAQILRGGKSQGCGDGEDGGLETHL